MNMIEEIISIVEKYNPEVLHPEFRDYELICWELISCACGIGFEVWGEDKGEYNLIQMIGDCHNYALEIKKYIQGEEK